MKMSGLKTDDTGQWLLLGSMIVAVGLAVLIVFVNQFGAGGALLVGLHHGLPQERHP